MGSMWLRQTEHQPWVRSSNPILCAVTNHYMTLGSLPPQSGPQFPNYTMRTFNQMISLVPLHATAPRIYDFVQEDLAQTLGNKWHGVYW